MYLGSLYPRHFLRSAIQKYQLIFLIFFFLYRFNNMGEVFFIIDFFLPSSFSFSLSHLFGLNFPSLTKKKKKSQFLIFESDEIKRL